MKGVTFTTMDGLRGVAALMVVAYHAPGSGHFPASAYLAVDLFFALSGFVLAHSSMDKLATLSGAVPFLIKRLIRLYPLYMIGLALGVAAYLARAALEGPFWLNGLIAAVGLNAFFLPVPHQISLDGTSAFPLNGPAWSLSFEMLVNLAMAMAVAFYTVRRLGLLIVLSGAGLIAAAIALGHLDGGVSTSTAYVGLARVTFSFLVGVAHYRLWKVGHLKSTLPWWVSIGALIAVLCIPVEGAARVAFDLLIVMVVFPALLATATGLQPRPILQYLGRISYGVYVLHLPILLLIELASRQIAGRLFLDYGLVGTALVLVVTVLAATLLDPLDASIRQAIARRLDARRAKLQQADQIAF